MSGGPNDDRPPMVVAMQWVQQITSIAVMMVLPAGLGYLADQRWKTEPWFVSIGAVIGFATAMLQLLKLANKSGKRPSGHLRQRDDAGPKRGSGRVGD